MPLLRNKKFLTQLNNFWPPILNSFTLLYFEQKDLISVLFCSYAIRQTLELHMKRRLQICEIFFPYSFICSDSPCSSICNGQLPRAGSSAPSVGLLTRSSLFGDGPVLTGALTFRSVSRFPDGMATTKQQTMDIYFIKQSETRIDDDVNTSTLLATCQPRCKQPLPYSSSDLHLCIRYEGSDQSVSIVLFSKDDRNIATKRPAALKLRSA
ncbi:hypothetical protein T09_258 [Trichinella sp. T9]|nr:hypothetical protein T09_258 [Trichinella sp. T9]